MADQAAELLRRRFAAQRLAERVGSSGAAASQASGGAAGQAGGGAADLAGGVERAARTEREAGAGREAGAELAEVAAHAVGLQAQDTTAMRLSARARAQGMTRDRLREAVGEPGHVVRTWLMRGTLHLVAGRDVRWLLGLFGARNVKAGERRRRELGLDEAVCRRALEVIPEVLTRPMSRAELVRELNARGVQVDPSGQAPAHLVGYAAGMGLVCRGPDLEGDEPGLVLLDDWVPSEAPVDQDEALRRLGLRYFAGYGPAGAADLAAFSGLPLGQARRAAELAGDDLSEADGLYAGDATVYKGQVVRLLPAYDTYLLGYAGREPMLDERYAKRIQAGGGVIHPTVVCDGKVVGRWRIAKGRVELEGFGVDLEQWREQLEVEAVDVGDTLGRPLALGAHTLPR